MFIVGMILIAVVWIIYIGGFFVINGLDNLGAWMHVYPVFGIIMTLVVLCILGWLS